MHIKVDSFTREYQITRDDGSVLSSNRSGAYFPDAESYYEYIDRIDYLCEAYINLTKRCNFNCVYCYSKANSIDMSIEDYKLVLEKLRDLNTRNIAFIGGEPTIHPDFETFLELALRDSEFDEICIITNGFLIKPSLIPLLKNPRVYLQVSLDGYNEETNCPTRGRGHFAPVFKTLSLLKREGVNFRVMKVITRNNIEMSLDFFDWCEENRFEAGFFMVKQVPDDEKPTLAQLESLLNGVFNRTNDIFKVFDIVCFADNMMFNTVGFPVMHCGAGITSISILPNGDVCPCVKREMDEEVITNIRFKDANDAIRNNRTRILHQELVNKKVQCMSCDIKYFCGGGCRSEERNDAICTYNCDYFHFALRYFFSHIFDSGLT